MLSAAVVSTGIDREASSSNRSAESGSDRSSGGFNRSGGGGGSGSRIWIARLRTGRVVIFRVSGSKAFKAAALVAAVALAAVDASAVIAAVVAADLVAVVIALVVAVAFGRFGGWRRRRVQRPTMKINAWRVLSYFL